MMNLPFISRSKAKAQGLTRYFTGKPCVNGHISERSVSNCACRECYRALYDPDKAKKRFAEYKRLNPSIVRESNYYSHIKRAYGMSKDQFLALLKSQGSKCAICFSNKSKGKKFGPWTVDHCHKTGKIRGILCQDCNAMLGRARDMTWVLENGSRYVSGSPGEVLISTFPLSMGA